MTTATAAAKTILVIDRGKYKSVVCIYRSANDRGLLYEADAVASTISVLRRDRTRVQRSRPRCMQRVSKATRTGSLI